MNILQSSGGGSRRRKAYTSAEKWDLLAGYENAILAHKGGAYLNEKGMYPSQITEWRKLRDSGLLSPAAVASQADDRTTEQNEISRLRRELEKSESQRKKTADALEIIGKLSSFFEESLSEQDEVARHDRRSP
ncbi:hypothetical protein [Glutamicibacter arilaitensis]|uniref:hypothetical protein n=1 Tax=Glutamicibacter arilaitensis TaxID=256701 RepID=UPI003FD5E98A